MHTNRLLIVTTLANGRFAAVPLIDRLIAKTVLAGECLLWTAGTDDDGYGIVWSNGRNVRAHRAAWELVNGPVPDGLLVLHSCDNPPCVRVSHLFLGTQLDNVRDCEAKGRRGVRPSVDRCPKGHEYTAENIKKASDGRKRCRTCHRATNNRARDARAA